MISVLIVDDQPLFAESLRIMLDSSADDITVVDVAENGEKALRSLSVAPVDVVMMDIRMPVMDGVVATKLVAERHPETKVLMLTTFDDDDLIYSALRAGAIGYILKNITPDELILAVRAAAGGAYYISPTVGMKLFDRAPGFHFAAAHHFEVAGDASEVSRIANTDESLTFGDARLIQCIMLTMTNKEIASDFGRSEQTIKNRVRLLYRKLGVHSRLELINRVAQLLSE